MHRHPLALAALLTLLGSAASGAETCSTSDVPSILAGVRRAEDQGKILGVFPTRAACFTAWGDRLQSGQTDEGKHLACVTRQTVLGAYRTELRALDFETHDRLCLRINACLFDFFGRTDTNVENRSLGRAWDRLSCDGH